MEKASLLNENRNRVVGAKITHYEKAQIQELVNAGIYLNFSDFFREAIRAKLAEVKVVKCRDIDYETAKKEIIGYFQRSGEAYSDEIAQDLELDFELVRQIEAELRREGRIEAI